MSASQALVYVQFEMQQLDRLLTIYADLIEGAVQQTPDLVAMTALASVLHSFSNGLENIFLTVAQRIDQRVPTGNRWHQEVLLQMARPSAARGAVLTTDLVGRLAEYLAFRHFYRHSYSFVLDWAKLRPLVVHLHRTWADVKAALTASLNQP